MVSSISTACDVFYPFLVSFLIKIVTITELKYYPKNDTILEN